MKILVINPGSTSTKVALFDDLTSECEVKLNHSSQELAAFPAIRDQLPMRTARVREFLEDSGIAPKSLDAVVARGGLLPPVRHGAYVIDPYLVDTLLNRPAEEHASNLGAGIAWEICGKDHIPAYIYDSVAVDELIPVARLSGVKGYDRRSFCHVLNMRAVARAIAEEAGFDLEESNVIVVHLGGGISLSVQSKGSLIDVISADDGSYSTDRSGGLPVYTASAIAREEGADALYGYATGKGGLLSYTGSMDALAIEERALAGDGEMRLLYEGMAYQVAKAVGGLATVVAGDVQAIILTGGLARSKLLTGEIEKRVIFIAPVYLFPGELEMEALAAGALRVLKGDEDARILPRI